MIIYMQKRAWIKESDISRLVELLDDIGENGASKYASAYNFVLWYSPQPTTTTESARPCQRENFLDSDALVPLPVPSDCLAKSTLFSYEPTPFTNNVNDPTHPLQVEFLSFLRGINHHVYDKAVPALGYALFGTLGDHPRATSLMGVLVRAIRERLVSVTSLDKLHKGMKMAGMHMIARELRVFEAHVAEFFNAHPYSVATPLRIPVTPLDPPPAPVSPQIHPHPRRVEFEALLGEVARHLKQDDAHDLNFLWNTPLKYETTSTLVTLTLGEQQGVFSMDDLTPLVQSLSRVYHTRTARLVREFARSL